MAAPRTKQSAAYEAGLREGRADKSKPKVEIEISTEGEEEEGPEGEEEMDSTSGQTTNRKRSAKNANRTTAPMDGGMYGKKPMDAECGCGGKGRKGKAACDGNCGGMKRDRADAALTPHEYLAACELGIQDRSRVYIRSRLDVAERLDLKCGRGSISPGEKCTKGAAQKTDPKPAQRKGITGKALLATGLAVGGGYLALKNGRAAVSEVREIGGSVKRLMESKAKLRAVQAQNKRMGISGEGESGFTRFLDRLGPDKRRNALERAFKKRSAKRPRRDSVYAPGFSPDLAQLAI